MPRRTEIWEGCRWTRIDPLVNVVPSDPTVHEGSVVDNFQVAQLLYFSLCYPRFLVVDQEEKAYCLVVAIGQ